MRWKGRRRSTNIEDRRTAARGGPGRPGAGMGLPGRRVRLPSGRTTRRTGGGGLLILVVVGLFLWLGLGMNPLQVLAVLTEGGGMVTTGEGPFPDGYPGERAGAPDPADEEMKAFVATVLAETEDTWSRLFREAGGDYAEPTLVLFTGTVRSACGFAGAAAGPFYCPADSKVYLDMAFFHELARRFGAPGDFAQAYVIAHEVGHHVQNELGILPEANRLRQRLEPAAANAVSVRIELQADCLAGVWAHYADAAGLLEKGDIAEALGAARAVGDDTIQRRTRGTVVPESFSHGTGAQRQRWFTAGLENGSLEACDTFNARTL